MRTVAAFEVFLLLLSFEFIEGQNVVLHVDSCYEVGTDMTITAEYTGTDTFSTVEWFYSEQTLSNTAIIPSTCSVFGSIAAGFPTPFSRISFQCPVTGLPQNNFTLTVENITKAELTNKRWGAKFGLDNDPAEEDEKHVTMCQGSTPGPTPGPRCWCWCWWGCCDDWVCIIFCWIVLVLIIAIILYLVGIIVGVILTKTRCCCRGFYRCDASVCCQCCQCCASLPCKDCCNIAGLPLWVHVLCVTIIGALVSLGIYTYRKCFGKGSEKVRYVVVKHDDNGSPGFNHGSVIVTTSITPGGHADKKLKVGEHVHKVGDHRTEGRTLDEIRTLLENTGSNLTLTVSKVGSDATRSVEIQEKPFGFVFGLRTRITKVHQGGPASGKLKVGERVLSINGKSTESKTNREINDWLRPTSNSIQVSRKKGGKVEDIQFTYDWNATLGIEIDINQDKFFVVSKVTSTSTTTNIKQGDVIVNVNGESTKGMTIKEVREKMKSVVELKVTEDVTLLELDSINGSFGLEVSPQHEVTKVTPGGSAATAGIKIEQRILSINGEDTDQMSQAEVRTVLHSRSMKSITLELGEGSSPDAKHTEKPRSSRSSNEKSANKVPSPEISPADGAYGGGKDTRIDIENDSVSYSKNEDSGLGDSSRRLPPTGHDVPGHHFHEKLPGIQN